VHEVKVSAIKVVEFNHTWYLQLQL